MRLILSVLSHTAQRLLVWLMIATPAPWVHAQIVSHPRNHVAFYLQAYGEVPAARNRHSAAAHRVFERVRAAADYNRNRPPRLVVVDSPNGDPWAIALPDGHIVLSTHALDICFREPVHADACLAFVLGHELAHLASDDFLHQEIHHFLASEDRIRGGRPPDTRVRESAADDRGYIYAAMAGYPVARLLESRDAGGFGQGWFRRWMEQSNARMSEPGTAAERGRVLERRLQQVEAARVFFEFGTRLSHFDYCDDALWFLREFLKVLPAREVQNNLGLCHLQLARQRMPAELAYLYWMPGVLDGQLRAAAMSTRGTQAIDSLRGGHVAERLSEKARRHLRQAVEYLQSARAADRHYLPARQNLAIAHLYLGQPHAARAVLDEAVAIVPHDIRTAMLTAITVYEQGDEDVDLRPTAIKRLRALREQLAGDREHGSLRLAIEFNLARLLSLGGQDAAAETHWAALAAQARALPTPIRQQVCVLPDAQAQCASGPPVRRGDPPWRMPLHIERFESMSAADVAAQLPGWQVTDFDGFDGRLHGSIVRRADGGGAVLVLDDFVQMQVLVATDPARPLGLVRDVIAYCGADLRERLTAYGRLLSCDRLAAVERDGQLQEVWWVSR